MFVRLLVVVMVMVVMVIVESEAAPTTHASMNHLIREEKIKQQLMLIDKLVFSLTNKCSTKDKNDDTPATIGATSPTTTTTTATTTTATTMMTTTSAPELCYKKFTATHTMLLQKNPDCEIHTTGISSPEEQQLILDLHNTLRAKVARGEETRGAPGPQPPAANIREMVWNDELAKVAQAWASQCPSNHDSSAARRVCGRQYLVGQNIHYYWGSNPEPDWKRGIDQWYDEVVDVPHNLSQSFHLLDDVKIGHYTQVVWADTSEIGCGMIYYNTEKNGIMYPESKTYVCNYGKAGNILDRPLYIKGPAASQCPNGVSKMYPDLCA